MIQVRGGVVSLLPRFTVFWADSWARRGVWETQGGLEGARATEFIGLHGGKIAVVWTSVVLDMSNYY